MRKWTRIHTGLEGSFHAGSICRRLSAVLLVLFLPASSLVFAQALQTGTITGKVGDKTGARVPGVTVTLTSPVLMTPRTTTTDSEGVYRFPALPPGTYAVAFELANFRKLTRSGIPVSLATTLTIDATLEVGAMTENVEVLGAPVIDVTQTNVATNLDVNALQEIPTARDVWAILQNMAPQVVLDREDVGGSQGGLQAVFSTHGSTWHQNTYAMNGVNVTDPAATGAAQFYYDYDSFQEVNISTAQHSAEIGTPGVYFNLVAKRGTDAYHGGLAYYYENKGWVSNNVNQALKDQGITSGAGINLFSDATAQLGGPLIKDKLRFYTAWRDWRIHRNVPNFPKSENTDLFSGLVNASYQFNPQNRLDVLWTRQTYYKPNRNASAQVQPDSTWIEDDVFRIYQGNYSSQISSNALFDARVSYSDIDFPLKLQPGVTQPNTTELTTGNQTGVAGLSFNQHRSRFSASGTFSYVKGRLAGADHDFKAGYEYYRGYASGNIDALGGVNLNTFNGKPSSVTEYNTPVPSVDQFTGSVVFLQDSISKDRLVVNLGLRFEHTLGYLPAQSKPAGPFSAAQSFPEQDVIKWTDLAPRVGLVYDITGDHKAAFKLGYGRYFHQISTGMIDVPNQNGLGGKGYSWIDRNGDGQFQPGEEGNLLFAFGGSITSVDPNLKRPRTDEVTAGFEFELPQSIKLSIDGVFRWGRNLIAITETGIPFDTGYTTTTARDPVTNQVLTVFNLRPEFAGKNKRLETNPPDFKSSYKGVEVTLQKRFSSRWQGLLAYALSYDDLSRTGITLSQYGGEEEGAGGIGFGVGSAFVDPNQKINNTGGPSFYNRRHSLKVSGSYEIPKIDVNVAGVFKVQSGVPYGRILSLSNDINGVAFNQGAISFFADPRDAHHLPTLSYVDFRIGKFFTINKQHRIEINADFFNLFNQNAITNVNPNTGTAFAQATDILGPRVFRIGARWTF
jgi:hypothetical protein